MADDLSGGGVRFPKADFSFLGNLPTAIREYQGEEALKQSLADLKSSDPKSLREAANRALATGTQKGIEVGTRLYAAAQARENLAQKSEADRAYGVYIQGVLSGKLPGVLGGKPANATEDSGDVQYGGGPQAPGVLPSQRPPVAFPPPPSVGPQSAIESTGQVAQAPQGPGEAMLARAQGAMAPPVPQAPPVQLAGPPPAPGPVAAPGISPETVAAAQARPVVAPQAAPPGVGTAGPMPTVPQSVSEGQANMVQVGNQMLQMPPKSQGQPAFQVFMAQFRNALAKQKLSPEMESYRLDQAQRAWAGDPGAGNLSFADWKAEIAERPQNYKLALKNYEDINDTGNKAQGILNTVNRLDQISKDKNFVSGLQSGRLGNYINQLSSLAQIGNVANWVPDTIVNKLKSIADPALRAAALREEFMSLANQAVLNNAGSLSKGFSEGDRVFTEKIFPAIAATPGGIAGVIDNLRQIADHNVALAKVANDYMKSTQRGAKSNPFGLRDAIQQYNDEHPLFVNRDGSLTKDGKELQNKVAPPAASGEMPAGALPATGPKGAKGYQLNGRYFLMDGTPVQ